MVIQLHDYAVQLNHQTLANYLPRVLFSNKKSVFYDYQWAVFPNLSSNG